MWEMLAFVYYVLQDNETLFRSDERFVTEEVCNEQLADWLNERRFYLKRDYGETGFLLTGKCVPITKPAAIKSNP
jgi:hypothetical protein